jgi:putative AbiEii toxin of type IV toxin-antitoxin system
MKILAFEHRDTIRDWTLERVTFDGFDLLVGVSGAGKTRIVRALEQVCAVALGSKELEERIDLARGAEFAIEFEHEGLTYRWQAELQKPSKWPEGGDGTVPVGDPPLVRVERLAQGGRLLIERDEERFVLDGKELPRLDRTKSAIAILKEDTLVAPIYAAFSRCIAPKTIEALPGHDTNTKDRLEKWRQKYRTVDELGADFSLGLHRKAEALEELFPRSFAGVREAFQEAFPSVSNLWIHRFYAPDVDRGDDGVYGIAVSASEEGVKKGFAFHDMSSGMQRYLSFLIHLSFAPPGTVVLVDELESSLGVNCLPAVTRFLLRRAPDLQFIVTSHHPYIIEQIPPTHWKIVTRHGSRVRVLDAKTIPALVGGRSHLDRFTRLMNLPEYEQGIQGTGS